MVTKAAHVWDSELHLQVVHKGLRCISAVCKAPIHPTQKIDHKIYLICKKNIGSIKGSDDHSVMKYN